MKRKAKITKRKKQKVKITRTQSRYRFKPGFAVRVKENALKSYRAKKGKDFELGGATVLRSLDFVEDYAETLPTRNIGEEETRVMQVVRLTKLADLLDTTYQTIWRWSSDTQQLPEPALVEDTNGRERPVYHIEEVRVIIQVIGEHLNKFRYYRKDHNGTRDRLFNEIENLRNLNYGEDTYETQRKKTSGKTDNKSGRRKRG